MPGAAAVSSFQLCAARAMAPGKACRDGLLTRANRRIKAGSAGARLTASRPDASSTTMSRLRSSHAVASPAIPAHHHRAAQARTRGGGGESVAQGTMTLAQYVLSGPNGPPHLGCCGNWFTLPKSFAVVG